MIGRYRSKHPLRIALFRRTVGLALSFAETSRTAPFGAEHLGAVPNLPSHGYRQRLGPLTWPTRTDHPSRSSQSPDQARPAKSP